MKRDAFGLQRLYYSAERHASTVRDALGIDRSLDLVAINAHLADVMPNDRTIFAAVEQVPPGHELYRREESYVCVAYEEPPPRTSFVDQLRVAVRRAVDAARRPTAVALSGGLDSAVILALAREIDRDIEAVLLVPEITGYSETDAARTTATELGAGCYEIRVTEDAFVRPLRDALAAFETPLYNLHPLSKWHLARGAKAAGLASVISGDGADQVFRHDVSADYLPLVGAAFDAHGVALHAPFLDTRVGTADPDKRPLRELAAALGIRDELVRGPKVSRLAPDLPFDAPRDRLAQMLGRPLGSDHVRWGTLALLVDHFGAWT